MRDYTERIGNWQNSLIPFIDSQKLHWNYQQISCSYKVTARAREMVMIQCAIQKEKKEF